MGVRGSVSRDLIRAGSIEDTIDPVAPKAVDEAELIKVINQYEASRREGTLTTFRYLGQYLSDPRNSHIIDARNIHAKLNELVASGILIQEVSKFDDGGEIRITKLDRTNPAVITALSTG